MAKARYFRRDGEDGKNGEIFPSHMTQNKW
jgi:hypothetical protein